MTKSRTGYGAAKAAPLQTTQHRWCRRSLRREPGWALFDIGGQSFLCVFTLEEQLLMFALQSQARFQRDLPAGLNRALDASHGFRGFVGWAKLASIFHRAVHKVFVGQDFVY